MLDNLDSLKFLNCLKCSNFFSDAPPTDSEVSLFGTSRKNGKSPYFMNLLMNVKERTPKPRQTLIKVTFVNV